MFLLSILLTFIFISEANAQSIPYPATDYYVTFNGDNAFSRSITINPKHSAPYYILEFTVPQDGMMIVGSVNGNLHTAKVPYIEKIEGYYVTETIYNTQRDQRNFGIKVNAGKYRLIISGMGGEVCQTYLRLL